MHVSFKRVSVHVKWVLNRYPKLCRESFEKKVERDFDAAYNLYTEWNCNWKRESENMVRDGMFIALALYCLKEGKYHAFEFLLEKSNNENTDFGVRQFIYHLVNEENSENSGENIKKAKELFEGIDSDKTKCNCIPLIIKWYLDKKKVPQCTNFLKMALDNNNNLERTFSLQKFLKFELIKKIKELTEKVNEEYLVELAEAIPDKNQQTLDWISENKKNQSKRFSVARRKRAICTIT